VVVVVVAHVSGIRDDDVDEFKTTETQVINQAVV